MSPGTENNDIFQTRTMTRRPRKTLKDDNVVNDALQCMKRLTDTVAQQDSFSVYGEHVANKLWACNSEYAVTVAQHHIDNILFNLAIGTYHHKDFPPRTPSNCSSASEIAYTLKLLVLKVLKVLWMMLELVI